MDNIENDFYTVKCVSGELENLLMPEFISGWEIECRFGIVEFSGSGTYVNLDGDKIEIKKVGSES